MPGCPRVAVFTSTLIDRNWSPGRPRIAVSLSTLTARSWNLVEWSCSYFFAFHIVFFYTQLAFFHLLRDFDILHSHILAFCFFFSSVTFWYFDTLFLSLLFVFLIISNWQIFRHFYIYEKKLLKIHKKLMLKKLIQDLFILLLL